MTRKVHLTKQEELILEKALQIRDSDPIAPSEDQLWINVTNNSINLAKTGGVVKLNDTSFSETITVTTANMLTKTVTVSSNVQYPSRTKIFPQGGPVQIYSKDFTVVAPNIIAWGGMGLDGLIEEGDSIVIECS
jgi:hypothetical protein